MRLLSRIEKSFPVAYLTLVSIIQGVAFAFLVQQWPQQGHPFQPYQWVLFFTTAGFIALGWQEYLIGATMFAWVPTIIDALVPFGLALMEAIVAASIGVSLSRYIAACMALAACALVAYRYYYFQAGKGLGDSSANFHLFRPLQRSALMILFLSCPYYLLLWAWTLAVRSTASTQMAVALLCALPAIAMFLRVPRYWNRVIRTFID